jgi:ubiquinone/menaquinone biosynthesis C-methylase UbiE
LLYCWYACLAPEFDESTPVEKLLEELRRVAKEQGFISASDISKRPGRPPRVFKLKNKRRLKRFVELQSRYPDLGPDQISMKVADREKTRSNNDNRNIQIEVRRFFQRQGLVPKSPPPKKR